MVDDRVKCFKVTTVKSYGHLNSLKLGIFSAGRDILESHIYGVYT